MSKRTAIITGGNSGLGYQCAKAIAADHNWHVVIACRNQEKANKALGDLIAETSNEHIETMTLDLASLTSIRQFPINFSRRNLPPLQAVVANAGTQVVGDITYTEDGFETTFGVNHLGHFLLVNLLLQYLVSPARIVVVSSGAHDPDKLDGKIAPPRYQEPRLLAYPSLIEGVRLSGIQRYTTSKLCNLLFAYELAHRLEVEGHNTSNHRITVNAFDPGGTPGTGLTREYNPIIRFGLNSILPRFRSILKLLGTTVNDVNISGQMMARLVLAPQLEDLSGKYFQGMEAIPSSKESYDRQKAAELWAFSVKLVKLQPSETILQVL